MPRSAGSPDRPIDRLTDRNAVLKAMDEYDRMGRERFNAFHGFGGARRFRIVYMGRLYDAKSVLLAAYGYQYPAEGPLANSEVASNRREVHDPLVRLGFDVAIEGT